MPNWCGNQLYVRGEKEAIQAFLKKNKGYEASYFIPKEQRSLYHLPDNQTHLPPEESEFTFNAMVPVPQEVLDEGYSDAGYHWQISNWGTKWDACSVYIEHLSDKEVCISFSTAWSPPTVWFHRIVPHFPNLELELLYEEGGCVFAGRILAQDGDIVDQKHVNTWEEYVEFVTEQMGYDMELFEEEE